MLQAVMYDCIAIDILWTRRHLAYNIIVVDRFEAKLAHTYTHNQISIDSTKPIKRKIAFLIATSDAQRYDWWQPFARCNENTYLVSRNERYNYISLN